MLVNKWRADAVCIQESKLDRVEEIMCKRLWGSRKFRWAYKPTDGRTGGLITIWNEDKFQSLSSWDSTGILVVNGIWKENGKICTLVNIHAPNTARQKWELWDSLSALAEQCKNECFGVIGDINAIKDPSERVGKGLTEDKKDMDKFGDFIEESQLWEMPLVGKRFNWYRPDGSCKSKLDRFLIYEDWMLNWPSQKLRGGRRSLSDHKPIYVEEDAKDWGPKPFKLFNWWLNKKSFVDLVESKWNSYNIVGHASYRFKEKLKCLKVDIKQWKSLHAGNPDPKIEKLIQEIEEWDTIDDTFGLKDDEAEKRKMLMGKLSANWQHKVAELCQMAKLKWAKQGDANSSLFHRMINKKAKVNDINGIRIGDRWVDSVKDVKGEIISHFSLHFSDPLSERPKLKADIFNRSISPSDKAWLESPFSEADIKQAIWDCELDASPGPNGFTFGFFKKF
ncbi:hypothetical protein ACS0TY_023782 [Phlomoides rotata]